ncbi:MAG: glycoside hydrolase family 3 protein [Lentisphaeria bacterium]|nr:glycoside hydrolase family 3 protein [Lentisphaeria bacterium]
MSDFTESELTDLLNRLTLDEKIRLCAGIGGAATFPVTRLGIHSVKMVDGPQGVRVPRQEDGTQAVALPCGIALSAAFDPELAAKYGRAIALDAKALGFSVSLGPGLNLMRTPLCGRNFEYYGEDPHLAGKIAAGYTRGCQSENIAATPKHIALNNQEICRTIGSSDIDERSLRELYLTGFEITVKESQPWLMMSSYNRINGTYASECALIQDQIPKREWGFDGVMISDWGSTHDPVGCLLGGLDLEMPAAGYGFPPEQVRLLIESGMIPQQVIDEKVRRILRLLYRLGAIGKPVTPSGRPGGEFQQQTARETAKESIVLLKNASAILPFDRKKIRKILLTGPNADFRNHRGTMQMLGGSGAVFSDRELTLKEAFSKYAAGNALEFEYIPSVKFDHDRDCPKGFFGSSGIQCDYYHSREDMEAGRNRLFSLPNFEGRWDFTGAGNQAAGGGIEGLPKDIFSIKLHTILTPDAPDAAELTFIISNGFARIKINGITVFEQYGGRQSYCHSFAAGTAVNAKIELEYSPHSTSHAGLHMAWRYTGENQWDKLFTAAKNADAVIFAGGTHHLYDREGLGRGYDPTVDIPDLKLPAGQSDIIRHLTELNPSTVVLLTGGSVMDLEEFIEQVPAVMDLWYPGEAGNMVAVEMLFGEHNPAGHLPFTWAKKLDDYACHGNGNYPGTVTGDPRVRYDEGLFMGYRHFDRNGILPRFPFGFGLSYSEFSTTLESVEVLDNTTFNITVKITVAVKNISGRAGSELIQIYTGAVSPEFPRPEKELKAFRKIHLQPGECRCEEFSMQWRDFACWHPELHHWCVPAGNYRIFAARNAADILASATINVVEANI